MRAPRPLTQSGLIVLPVAIQPIRPKPVERRGSTGSPRTGFNERSKLIPPVRPEPVEGQARPARDSTGAPCAKTSPRTGQNGRIQYPLQNGFTLVELAVVMVILGLLLGGLMLPLAAQREIQQQRAAEAALREIREALLGYAVIHGHLPCPDTDTDPTSSGYGVAEASCASATQEGYLPFKTLGLTEADPWEQRWRYRVDSHFANVAAPITFSTAFSANDRLRVVNHENQYLTTEDERPVAIFYSLGPNARADGGNASFEANGGLYQANPPTADFDDQLWWLARPLLFSRLIAAGREL